MFRVRHQQRNPGIFIPGAMNLTEQSRAFYDAVYLVTSQVPYGKVTSYGHIAYLVGKPQNSRQVGTAMKLSESIIPLLNSELTGSETSRFETLPWWRVLLSSGKISPRGNSGSELRQAEKLRQENVDVLNSLIVSLDTYGWFPDEVDV